MVVRYARASRFRRWRIHQTNGQQSSLRDRKWFGYGPDTRFTPCRLRPVAARSVSQHSNRSSNFVTDIVRFLQLHACVTERLMA